MLAIIYQYNYVTTFFICGGFNSRLGEKLDYIERIVECSPRQILDKNVNKHGESFLEFLKNANSIVVNGRITPEYNDYTSVTVKGKSVVDYIAVPIDSIEYCKKFKVLQTTDLIDKLNLSSAISSQCKAPDHALLTLTYTFEMIPEINISNDQRPQTRQSPGTANATLNTHRSNQVHPRRKRYYFNNKPDTYMNNDSWDHAVLELLSEIEFLEESQREIDSLYDKLCETIFTENDKRLLSSSYSRSTKKLFKYHKPYWNSTLTTKWNEMRESEKSFKKLSGNNVKKNHLRNTFKIKQTQFNKLLRKTERSYYKQLSEEMHEAKTKNPKLFWHHLNKLGPRKHKVIPEKVYINGDSRPITESLPQVLSKWQNDFSNLYNIESNNLAFDREYLETITQGNKSCQHNLTGTDHILNDPIQFSEVESVVKNIKNNKACGPDYIQNEVLKNQDILHILHKLFKYMFSHGCLPSAWKKAIITPILKSSLKDPYIPLNYRGISLLSNIGKAYTVILNKRLITCLENNNLLCEEQNGFRPKRSCEEHIYTLTSIVRNRLGMGQATFAAFIDFQKAFDWVNRDILLNKLREYGITGKIFTSIKNLYTQTNAQVKLNQNFTEPFLTTSGVRQGDSMSPTLFNIFLNDLIKELKEQNLGINIHERCVSILAYADDIVLLAPDQDKLQKMPNIMFNWCYKHRLIINSDKSQIRHFRNRRNSQTNKVFRLGEVEIKIVEKYKYLGIILDEYLNYNITAETLCSSASRALGALHSKTRNLKNCTYHTYSHLFSSGICPILHYSSSIWGYKQFLKCQNVQNKAIRHFLGLNKFSPNLMLIGDMAWTPSHILIKINMIKLWNKICNLNVTSSR